MREHAPNKKQDLLSVALWIFLALSMDIVVHIALSQLISEKLFLRELISKSTTILIWCLAILMVYRYNKREQIFEMKLQIVTRRSLLSFFVLGIIIIVVNLYIKELGNIQIIHEFVRFIDIHQSLGVILFVLQIIYYICEATLITLIVIFAHEWGKKKFAHELIPYGGIILALTWGAVHFLSKDVQTGIYGIIVSLVIGIGFVTTKKNCILTYVLAMLLFII